MLKLKAEIGDHVAPDERTDLEKIMFYYPVELMLEDLRSAIREVLIKSIRAEIAKSEYEMRPDIGWIRRRLTEGRLANKLNNREFFREHSFTNRAGNILLNKLAIDSMSKLISFYNDASNIIYEKITRNDQGANSIFRWYSGSSSDLSCYRFTIIAPNVESLGIKNILLIDKKIINNRECIISFKLLIKRDGVIVSRQYQNNRKILCGKSWPFEYRITEYEYKKIKFALKCTNEKMRRTKQKLFDVIDKSMSNKIRKTFVECIDNKYANISYACDDVPMTRVSVANFVLNHDVPIFNYDHYTPNEVNLLEINAHERAIRKHYLSMFLFQEGEIIAHFPDYLPVSFTVDEHESNFNYISSTGIATIQGISNFFGIEVSHDIVEDTSVDGNPKLTHKPYGVRGESDPHHVPINSNYHILLYTCQAPEPNKLTIRVACRRLISRMGSSSMAFSLGRCDPKDEYIYNWELVRTSDRASSAINSKEEAGAASLMSYIVQACGLKEGEKAMSPEVLAGRKRSPPLSSAATV